MTVTPLPGLGFHHTALKTADLDRSLAFYTALGCKEILRWPKGDREIVMLSVGDGGRIELLPAEPGEFVENGKWVHFAFAVADVAAAFETALALGATPQMEPSVKPLESSPYRTSIEVAFVKGTEGEIIEFFRELC